LQGSSDVPYRFRQGETLGAGTRRIAQEIIDNTITCLGDARLSAEVRTHEARKAVKRLRGLMRLVGPELPSEKQFAALDRDLKNTGKLLAGARDSDVLRKTLCEVVHKENASAEPRPAPLDPRTIADRQRAFGQVMERLAAIGRDIGALRLEGNRLEDMKPGYLKTYRKSRKRMKEALRTRSDSQLHRWREMVKYHSYHTSLMANLDAGGLDDRREGSRALEETLGRHHDLAILESHIDAIAKKNKTKTLAGVPVQKLKRRIKRTRREAEREAEHLGRALFRRKPSKARKDLPL
jgi:CHAD domain-containing protein